MDTENEISTTVSPEEEALHDMSDEELAKAFKEAKVNEQSSEIDDEKMDNNDESENEETDTEEEVDVDDNEESLEQLDESTEDDEDSDDSDEKTDVDDKSEEDLENEDSTEESNEEQPEEDIEEPKEKKSQKVQKRKYKANGQEFEFTDDEIFEQFGRVFGQAMNYTKKMQAIAPYKGMISTIKEQELSQDDLNLAIDVLKGDKDAITEVLNRTGTDALDIDAKEVNADYRPTNYGKNETELAINEIVDEISNDKEYAITHNVIEQQWDGKSRGVFAKNPDMIKALHIDIQNGVFDAVSPKAMKLKVLDGGKKADIEYYMEAGKQYHEELRTNEFQQQEKANKEAEEKAKIESNKNKVAEIRAKEAKQAKIKQASKKRKNAAPTSSRAGKKDVIDYLDESDEAFDAWYAKLQEQY